MADSVTSKSAGLRELGDAMRELSEEVNLRLCRKAANAGARGVQVLAKQKAPVSKAAHTTKGVEVQPGNLRDNIVVKRMAGSKLTAEYVVTVRGGAEHGYASSEGRFNEFGTVKMAPHAFLRPAFEQGKQAAADQIKQTLATGIERAARKANRRA